MKPNSNYFSRNVFYLILSSIFSISMNAQTESTIKMKTKIYSDNEEIKNLMRFQEIDYYKIKFNGDLNGKNYAIIAKEIWNGKISKIDTLIDTSKEKFVKPISGDSLQFIVIASKSSKKELKIKFEFDRFSLNKKYKSTTSNDYSLRDFGVQMPITADQKFYSFAYILPYEDKSGYKSWCAVESSGKDIENWGKEFGLRHYILFEMIFKSPK